MEDDTTFFVQRCKECQVHRNLIHVPATTLHSISISWKFHSWGLDIIGKINPPSSKHHEYVITITEYFTKWVKAIDLRGTNGTTIATFIKVYIICRFGVPKHIVTDNGTPFANMQVRELLEEYGIKQVFSTINYTQGNGQAESTNKTLIRILSRTVHDNPRTWHDQLPMELWAYRTSPRSSIGVSPYFLVYGVDAILPAEIKIPSSRIAEASGIRWIEAEALNARVAELDTIDSRRAKAEENAQGYRNRVSGAYNKTVKPQIFQVGDLVLKTAKHVQQNAYAPKFSAKWEGPYIVTKAYISGYYKVIKEDGGKLEAVINGKWLKSYYA